MMFPTKAVFGVTVARFYFLSPVFVLNLQEEWEGLGVVVSSSLTRRIFLFCLVCSF